jgi:hypothetical protein
LRLQPAAQGRANYYARPSCARREAVLERCRIAAGTALLVIAVLIVAQLSGWQDLDEKLDAMTVVLLLAALVLLFATVAPSSTREFFERMTTLKLPGGVEIGLQAVGRAQRVQGALCESSEDLPPDEDDVQVKQRPLEGGTRRQFEAVRHILEERLKFVHTVVFGLDPSQEANYPQTLRRIEDENLLKPEELALVRDLLGRAEDEIALLPFELRTDFLDVSWRFALRFATLTHERLVRKSLVKTGWVLFDFEQKRSHRPEFLAYRANDWHLVAARVEPGKLGPTRTRLAEAQPPFEAKPLIVIPDKQDFESEGEDPGADVVELSQLLDPDHTAAGSL